MRIKATLSVVIPNYNHGMYLKELLPSLIQQSRPPEEIVIIDDGSTDDSVSIIQQFASQHPTIKFRQNDRNRGVIYTLNRAMELATGDYVTFPSADNFVLPGMYEKSLALLEQYPQAGLCCSDPMIFEQSTGNIYSHKLNLSTTPSYFSPQEVLRLGWSKSFAVGDLCHTVVIKRAAMQELLSNGEYFHSPLKWHADFFLLNVVALRYGVCYVPEWLAMFRSIKGSYCQSTHPWHIRRDVYRHMLNLLNLPPYADVKKLFQRSAVFIPLVYAMLKALLPYPSYYKYLAWPLFLRTTRAISRRFSKLRISA